MRPLALLVLVLLSGLSPGVKLGALVEGAASDAVAWWPVASVVFVVERVEAAVFFGGAFFGCDEGGHRFGVVWLMRAAGRSARLCVGRARVIPWRGAPA